MAEQILQLIAELRLQPGDRMPTETELAARLGTSRTVVREASRSSPRSAGSARRRAGGSTSPTTGHAGLLALGRASSCRPTSTTSTCSSSSAGSRRRRPAAWPPTRATPAELRAIEAAAETCRQGLLTGEAELFDRGDDDFHLGIAAASHNPFLVAAVREARRLQRQSSAIGLSGTVGGHAAGGVEEHAAIYHAIRDGDPEAAARAAAIHLDKTLEDYRREIQRRVFG